MMPTDFTEPTILEADILNETDTQLLDQLDSKGYKIQIGLNENYASDIIKICRQDSIREFCPNDSGKRFIDLEATEKWLSKGRAAVLLIKKDDGHVAGYGWTGTEVNEFGQSTFALRVSEPDQGQGLATPFARLIIAGCNKIYKIKDFWLETWQSDAAAVHIYHKIGFVDADQKADSRPTAVGDQIDDTRLYMTLSNDKL